MFHVIIGFDHTNSWLQLGGGTLWGLLGMMTGAKTFDGELSSEERDRRTDAYCLEMLALAQRGDNTKVDMLVEDIYGGGYDKIGLKPTTIASSFGKVFRMQSQANKHAVTNGSDVVSADSACGSCGSCAAKLANSLANSSAHPVTNGFSNATTSAAATPKTPAAHVKGGDETLCFGPEDISRSLLYAVSNNIGQLAYLHAQINHMKHIYFGGSFIRGKTPSTCNPIYLVGMLIFSAQDIMRRCTLSRTLSASGLKVRRKPTFSVMKDTSARWVRSYVIHPRSNMRRIATPLHPRAIINLI